MLSTLSLVNLEFRDDLLGVDPWCWVCRQWTS